MAIMTGISATDQPAAAPQLQPKTQVTAVATAPAAPHYPARMNGGTAAKQPVGFQPNRPRTLAHEKPRHSSGIDFVE